MSYKNYSLAERPDLLPSVLALDMASWPKFFTYSDGNPEVIDPHQSFPDYIIIFCNDSDEVIASGLTVPLVWDTTHEDLPKTLDDIILRAQKDKLTHQNTNALCPLSAIVDPRYRDQKISGLIINEMKSLARKNGQTVLILPVRPTLKERYPLTSMESYVSWRRSDGEYFDPWMRLHSRLGAQPMCIAPNTVTISGQIKDWEEWTEMAFPESGSYIVPGALQPIIIDHENDCGTYEESNYWMQYSIKD